MAGNGNKYIKRENIRKREEGAAKQLIEPDSLLASFLSSDIDSSPVNSGVGRFAAPGVGKC